MVGQEPCLALAELVGQHAIEGHRHGVVEAVVVQHLHILQLPASHHNAWVLLAVVAGLDHGEHMADHKLDLVYDDRDQNDGDYLDDRSFLQLAVEHMGQPAYHREQHLPDRHFGKHKQRLRDHRIALRAVQIACCQHSMLQYEQHQRHREQQGNAQWTAGGMHQMRLNEHQRHLGSHEF
jgi:hypothetical protein